MKTAKNLGWLLVTASVAFAAASAQASITLGDDLTITSTSLSGSGGAVSYNGGGAWTRTIAGAFSLNVVNHSQGGANLQIQSFCTDAGVQWQKNDEYTARSFANSGSGVNPAWSAGISSIQDAAYLYNTYFVGKTLTAAQNASLQLAIWKVLYDSVDGGIVANPCFMNGNLQACGFGRAVMADALAMVLSVNTAINNGTFVYYDSSWLSPNDGKSQGLIYTPSANTPNVPTTAVPEPATIVAGALMLLPFGISAVKIIRRKQAVQS